MWGAFLINNRAFIQQPRFPYNDPPLFVIPSAAEGSAVPRTFRGNVLLECVAHSRNSNPLKYVRLPQPRALAIETQIA
jgi:hypothetical protein